MCCALDQTVGTCRRINTASKRKPKLARGWGEHKPWSRGRGVAFGPRGGAPGRGRAPCWALGLAPKTRQVWSSPSQSVHSGGQPDPKDRKRWARQKPRWQETAVASSDLLWAEGERWEGLPGGAPSFAVMGALESSSQVAGGGTEVAWHGPGRSSSQVW